MYPRTIPSWTQLDQLPYFTRLADGRLALALDEVEEIVDFHTHLGFTMLLAPPIDFTVSTAEVRHNFGPELTVYLDIYSGQNIFEEQKHWGLRDYLPCGLSPVSFGRHLTHTLPNLLREMAPLKIGRSVCLVIDLATRSDNSERVAPLLAGEPRVVFYCSVHPDDPRAEEKIRAHLLAGAQGLKVHPQMQNVPVDSERMLRFLSRWRELSGARPVVFHTGFNGFEPKGRRENAAIERFGPALEALAPCPVVLGHAAMNKFQNAVDHALRYPHVYLEVGGQPPASLQEMIRRMGDDRILFGSDWPVYPQAMPLAKVLLATEGAPETRRKILHDNAAALLQRTAGG